MGTGEKKWTDDDVVECLQITKDLKDKGAFAEGFEGMDYNTQMNQFLTGEVAMISHSSPIIPEMLFLNQKFWMIFHSLHSHTLKINQSIKIHM